MADETRLTVPEERAAPRRDSTELTGRKRWGIIALGALVSLALALVADANFLLFHSLAELFSVVIAGGVFLVAWNSRKRLESNFLLVLGIAYAFVAVLDTLHLLAYAGMGVFPEHGANLPTQLWIAARYVEAVSITGAMVFIGSDRLDNRVSFSDRDRDTAILILLYLVVTAGLVGSIFLGVFPAAFIEGTGLTPFKILSEYVIIGILAVALGLLYRYRSTFEPHVYQYLGVSILLTMAAEFAFTQYVSVYGVSNMVGHLLKIVSFYLIYVAVIKTGISAPQELLFRQLTEERDKLAARERELEQRNTQLDNFASIVSHDLRNPLNVAQGRLDLAREECDSEHLDAVARAHDRMDLLIDDLLDLARAGELVSETELIDLGGCAESSWQNVATADATLRIETTRSIEADRTRLQQLLENLFRNAIEHAGENVTVTVGDLEDGFYIEDDGPGIPEGKRDEVFEAGYSSNPDGTGFGLSIVNQVAEAHTWELQVTDGMEGGARFEITGVEVAET